MKTVFKGLKINELSFLEKSSIVGGRLNGNTGRDQRINGSTGRDERINGSTGRDEKK